MPLRGLSLSIEVLLKMTNRMNKKMTTILPRLIRGRMSMNPAKYTPLYETSEILSTIVDASSEVGKDITSFESSKNSFATHAGYFL